MVTTDPIADMLTRIRNASSQKHKSVDVPASKEKLAIAQILFEEGYIKSFEEIKEENNQGVIRITLKYTEKGKKVIAVPRRAKYGEHVDDHQLQLVGQFKELQLICECDDAEKIGDALETVKKTTYKEYVSNTQRIISSIDKFIENK